MNIILCLSLGSIFNAKNEKQLKDNIGAIGWNLTKAQVAKLDAASKRPLPYPYWHQLGFSERNPFPVDLKSAQK